MKITILGAGAMGALFGGYLSQRNDVYLVDVDSSRIEQILKCGVRIREQDGVERIFKLNAVTNTQGLPQMDLIIVFVKSIYTESALENNRGLIGNTTYLMTLQNGAGHEEKLLQFVDVDHVIIGTTQHNSSIIKDGYVNHGGTGESIIGLLGGESERIQHIANEFTMCGFDCKISNDVKKQIWKKLFTNTAASSLTAVLQVPLGYIYNNPNARTLMHWLCKEAVSVANAQVGIEFDEEKVIADVEMVCKNAPNGYTSIYADVKAGIRSEVDTISGSVVEVAKQLGLSVPYHEMIVQLIHAMEQRNC